MFYKCSKLIEINNIENLDTAKVTNMWCMFNGCNNLTVLDVNGFDTRKVKNKKDNYGIFTDIKDKASE